MSGGTARDPAGLPPAEHYEQWMREALTLAREAAAAREVPVGAVVVRWGTVIGRGRERKIELSDPTAHAEVLALREAAASLGDWRLEDCALFVTLEPCPMCAGAALLARVPLVVYGAANVKFGAIETRDSLLSGPAWNHRVRTVGGVLADEAAALLTEFFAAKRSGGL
ncbi:MAG: tRNA adenosine(34) deaminase TadA [Candidatus Sumerlaeaceae bacterium]|nr:tRNA adenosine(34) deaminase TadA [Candidatus Sumerlaeaceae bacterium]